jgi:hypothetical protein
MGAFRALPVSFLFLLPTAFLHADDVIIEHVAADCVARECRFDVTLRHADSGWDHYADQWRVMDPELNTLGVRTLLHPHVDEQPFTRSLHGVKIPPHVSSVIVEGRDTVHGVSRHKFRLELDLK